jgi:hypothetical protein
MIQILLITLWFIIAPWTVADVSHSLMQGSQTISNELAVKAGQVNSSAKLVINKAVSAKDDVAKAATKRSLELRQLVRKQVVASQNRGKKIRHAIQQQAESSLNQLDRASKGIDNQFNRFTERLSHPRLS